MSINSTFRARYGRIPRRAVHDAWLRLTASTARSAPSRATTSTGTGDRVACGTLPVGTEPTTSGRTARRSLAGRSACRPPSPGVRRIGLVT